MTRTQIITMKRINTFKPTTPQDIKKLESAKRLLLIDLQRLQDGVPTDCGLFGKVDEVLNHDSFSTCYKPRSNKYHDLDPWVDGERYRAENKTNGGRIGKLYRMRDKDKRLIIYTLFYMTPIRVKKDGSLSGGDIRYVCKLLRVSTFLDILERVNATKVIQHKGYDINDAEVAIQSDSKKLYLELLHGGYTDFDRNHNYTWNEII